MQYLEDIKNWSNVKRKGYHKPELKGSIFPLRKSNVKKNRA